MAIFLTLMRQVYSYLLSQSYAQPSTERFPL